VDATVRAFRRDDGLVNNVGVATAVPASRETPQEYRRVIEADLDASYGMAQACSRLMHPGADRAHRKTTRAGGRDAVPRQRRRLLRHRRRAPVDGGFLTS
jgi:NAD(P)-dependent dehydrogenase (short-subunit alcohol dehydrogenase family)